jgi:hypothetical protein
VLVRVVVVVIAVPVAEVLAWITAAPVTVNPAVVLAQTNVYCKPAVVAAGSVHEGVPLVDLLKSTLFESAAVKTTVAPTSALCAVVPVIPPEAVNAPDIVVAPLSVFVPVKV